MFIVGKGKRDAFGKRDVVVSVVTYVHVHNVTSSRRVAFLTVNIIIITENVFVVIGVNDISIINYISIVATVLLELAHFSTLSVFSFSNLTL